LVFKRKDGSLVNIGGRGLGDLALAITKQPEYAQCQARTFWRWFLGNKPLSEEKAQELAQTFNSLERKPNHFISYIVNLPEFYNGAAPVNNDIPPQDLFRERIKPGLSKC